MNNLINLIEEKRIKLNNMCKELESLEEIITKSNEEKKELKYKIKSTEKVLKTLDENIKKLNEI